MRRLLGVCVVGLILAGVALPVGAQPGQKVSFVSPADGSTVTGPNVEVKLRVDGFTLVDAGSAVKAGEGHAHVFVDRNAVAAGQPIPTDQKDIVHFGKAPYDTRSIELQPGRHTLRAQLGDSSHVAQNISIATVTFTVAAAGQASPPSKPADTGDGSLADQGPGAGLIAAIGLALLALGSRFARRLI
jgi:hypothetical protein